MRKKQAGESWAQSEIACLFSSRKSLKKSQTFQSDTRQIDLLTTCTEIKTTKSQFSAQNSALTAYRGQAYVFTVSANITHKPIFDSWSKQTKENIVLQ